MSFSVLLVTGSTRAASTNSAALRTLHDLAPAGIRTTLYDGLADLPAFNPDDDREGETPPGPVVRLREAVVAADAVLFSTPEYAGTLPGSFKNLLDWTVGAGVLDGKPVGILNVAAPGRGEGAQATLVTVLGYVNARLDDAARFRVQVPREAVADGRVTDERVRGQLLEALTSLAAHVQAL